MAKQQYASGCQCGTITYQVEADLDTNFTCNCSRCKRIGAVLPFIPQEQFRLIRDGPVTERHFSKMVVDHLFCPTCCVETYATAKAHDGTRMIAVNMNCLDGVDPRALSSRHIDGASA